MDKVIYYRYEHNQLTCYTEYRNILIDKLIPVMAGLREQYAVQGWQELEDALPAAVHAAVEFDLVEVPDVGWLAFSIVEPWFLKNTILTEEFIYNVPVDTAVDILKLIAAQAGCNRILLGTRAAPGGKHLGLARYYERLGLKVSTIELTLETP